MFDSTTDHTISSGDLPLEPLEPLELGGLLGPRIDGLN